MSNRDRCFYSKHSEIKKGVGKLRPKNIIKKILEKKI
jgi:hypothetical protein